MYERIDRLVTALSTGLYERDEAMRLGLLASVAGESMFLLGPPGVGKSLIARRLQMVFAGAKSFSYLMGRFSTPDEVFGPLSIRKLKHEDRYERVTTDYLPDADVVFLDEIWKASPPIQNALLTALNERLYRNGSQEIDLPLKVFIGASNELPEEDETAAAFWDRFLVRLVLGPVASAGLFARLVSDTEDVYADVVPHDAKLDQEEFRAIQDGIARVAIPGPVMDLLMDIRGTLGKEGDENTGGSWYVSDRRWKKIVRLLRASALLHDRDSVQPLDCAVVRHCIWNRESEREPADRIVRGALAAHAGQPELLRSFRDRVTALEAAVREKSTEVVREEARAPVMHRDEYYRLTGADATHADATGPASGSATVLVWHGDVDDLAPGAKGTMDLFRYDHDGQLLGSEEVTATRASEWTLRIGTVDWKIQTASRALSRSRPRTLSADERAHLVGDTDQVIADARQAVDRMVDEQSALEDQARSHLFVPGDYARLVAAAVESAAAELTRVRITAEGLRGQLGSRT